MQLRSRRPPPPSSPLPDFQKRQAQWSSAPSIAEQFPAVGNFALEVKLRDPSGLRAPTPYRQTYEPQMRAFFDLRCPLHECRDGGFALNGPVLGMLSNARSPRSGTATCVGERQFGGRYQPCGLEMQYTLVKLEPA